MIETYFGSNAPIWTGIPSPAFGWLQPPVSIGNRTPTAAAPSGVHLDAFGFSGYGVPGIIPALAGPEVAHGPTGRALLSAVAIRRGQPMGPANDQEIEEFIYDAFDLLLGANDVEVRVDGGRATLTGTVGHKRVKRDVGEIVWAMPGISDVQNNVTIAGRRRSRSVRDAESPAAAARKTS